jgi:hypothetical protein
MKHNIAAGNKITYQRMIIAVTNVKINRERHVITVTSYKAVDAHHLVASREHRVREMAPEEASYARNEDLHDVLSITSNFSPRPASLMNIWNL